MTDTKWIGKLPKKDKFSCEWEFNYCHPHNGQYYWTCKKHNKRDWFGHTTDDPNEGKIKCAGAKK